MKCKTVVGLSPDGNPILKPKKVFDSFDTAINVASRMTRRSKAYNIVPYYCEKHKGYHVGTSNEPKKLATNIVAVGAIELVNKLRKDIKKTAEMIDVFTKKSGIFSTIWGDFEYSEKDKILVVKLPDGSIKKPKLSLVFSGSGNKHLKIKRFIKSEYLPLFKTESKQIRIKNILINVVN